MNNASSKSDPATGQSPSTMMAWLKLLRVPTVFTCFSNILCGYFVTSSSRRLSEIAAQPDFWFLLASSSCLYLSGMVLNDAFDAKLDAIERPSRPIPSGQVCQSQAFALGFLLMGLGIILAWFAGGTSSCLVAVGISCSVLLYDAILKNTFAAPFGMAVCRFLNLLLGCTTSIAANQLVTWNNPALPIAIGLAVYVFGVTAFAMNEAGRMSKSGLLTGAVIAMGAIGIHMVTAGRMYQATHSSAAIGSLVTLTLLTVNILIRVTVAVRSKESIRLQKTVGFMLLNIIFFDACMTFCLTGSSQLAASILILVIPATALKKILPLS